jgi:hypothetical protein
MRTPRAALARLGLAFFCIYLVAGGIFLTITILQRLEWLGPITLGVISLVIAYLAKLVFKDEIQSVG